MGSPHRLHTITRLAEICSFAAKHAYNSVMRDDPALQDQDGALPEPPVGAAVWGLAAVLVGMEALLWLCDQGSLPGLRLLLYLLVSVGAVPLEMAVTSGAGAVWLGVGLVAHALVHTGWLHVIGNAVGLLCFGHVVQRQAGARVFWMVFAVSVLAGALAFLLLAESAARMTGASGGVFGLLGLLLGWSQDRRMALRIAVLMGLGHLPVGTELFGPVAWQTHLGGAMAGLGLSLILIPRHRIMHPLM